MRIPDASFAPQKCFRMSEPPEAPGRYGVLQAVCGVRQLVTRNWDGNEWGASSGFDLGWFHLPMPPGPVRQHA